MIIETPPKPKGTPEQQIALLTNYLFRTSEKLNLQLTSMQAELERIKNTSEKGEKHGD